MTIRRGIAISEVRIIPVEYSAVSTSAPSTTMTSWPRTNIPVRLSWVASRGVRAAGGVFDQPDAESALIPAPIPALTANSTSSVW